MKKIPTIFKRNPDNMREILPEGHEDCDWVFSGEGIATRKYDGTCCRIKDGKLWKRREIKKGKPTPDDFELADYDDVTGKTVGWVPATDEKADKWHIEAFNNDKYADGTYELCGPKIQGNPEGFERHLLICHADAEQYVDAPRSFDGIRNFLFSMDVEGLVFHHPDGRMAKIKKRDYGQKRRL
jgi:hypothetical protein